MENAPRLEAGWGQEDARAPQEGEVGQGCGQQSLTGPSPMSFHDLRKQGRAQEKTLRSVPKSTTGYHVRTQLCPAYLV